MATIAHPRSGETIEGRRLAGGDTIQEGDLCAAYHGKWVLWPQLIDYTLPDNPESVWVRPDPT